MPKTDVTLKKIETLLDRKLDEKLAPIHDQLESHTRIIANIEERMKILVDIWDFVKSHAIQLKDHEDRISRLESSQEL